MIGFIIVFYTTMATFFRRLTLNFVINHPASLSQRECLKIFQRLSMLLEAGVPLSSALGILSDQSKRKMEKHYLDGLYTEVMNGRLLSNALTNQSSMPMAFKTLIALGEKTGTLPHQMQVAVHELWRARQARQRIMAALLYPSILLLVTLGITVFLLIGIFPKITPIFATFSSELPVSTRILIGLSNWLSDYGLWLLFFLIGLFICIVVSVKKSSLVSARFASILLHTPVVSYIIRTWNNVQITRMLAVLIRSGVRSSDSASIVAAHLHNPLYRVALHEVERQLIVGRNISETLARYKQLFTPDVVGLIGVAELSGSLPKTLDLIAALYEHDLDEFQKKLTTLIEPLLMIIMGLVIGFIAISIITPLYGLTNVVSE